MTAFTDGNSKKRWTSKEMDYLYHHYNDRSIVEIAKKLKRSYQSVYFKMVSMGLRKEVQEIRNGALRIGEVADALSCSENMVYDLIYTKKLPTRKVGSFYVIYESELDTWLQEGNILRFIRESLQPFYKHMYDNVRKQYYTTSELYSFNIPAFQPHHGKYQHEKQMKSTMVVGKWRDRQHFYYKKDVWDWAYKLGHTFCNDKLTHPDLIAIQTAWNVDFITTTDLFEQFSEHTINYYRRSRNGFPKATANREAYSRRELADWFRPFRPDIAQKLYRGLPVSYEQMIADYERRAQGKPHG